MGFFSGSNDAAIIARLVQVERKLDALMAALDVTMPADGMDDIRTLIKAGKKIDAIKAYRVRTGAGLKEAKDAVDRGL